MLEVRKNTRGKKMILFAASEVNEIKKEENLKTRLMINNRNNKLSQRRHSFLETNPVLQAMDFHQCLFIYLFSSNP